MTTASRDKVLADYCQRMATWATGEAVRLWRLMDPADLRGSWARIDRAMGEVHRALVIQTLTAIDNYMYALAADAGFSYEITWQQDYPQRPHEVYWGERSGPALARAPIVTLSQLSKGESIDVALVAGLNYLLSIFGTEAHQLQRTVLLERMLRQ